MEKLLELYALTNRIGYGKLYALCGVAGARHLRHIAAALEAERRRAVRAGGDAFAADRDNRTGQRCAVRVGDNQLYILENLAGQLDRAACRDFDRLRNRRGKARMRCRYNVRAALDINSCRASEPVVSVCAAVPLSASEGVKVTDAPEIGRPRSSTTEAVSA